MFLKLITNNDPKLIITLFVINCHLLLLIILHFIIFITTISNCVLTQDQCSKWTGSARIGELVRKNSCFLTGSPNC